MSVNELRIGEKAIISDILCETMLTKRLLSLGCVKGTEVQLKKIAPLGDPIVISLRGFDIAIRKRDAVGIKISAGMEE